MKILIVTQYFWPESFRINDLAAGLAEFRHTVTVLTGKPNYPEGRLFPGYGIFGQPRERYQGVTVLRVPLLPRGRAGALRLALNYLSFAVSAALVGPLRCQGSFDVILVYEPSPITVGIPAIVLKTLKHAPILFWVQDLWPESLAAAGAVRARWILKLTEWLTRAIYRGCDRVLVQSRAFIEPVARLGVARENIHYFPNSAEAIYRELEVEVGSVERRAMPQGFRVMFAGNIGAAQDFETIIGAAERLKSHSGIHWIIIGDGRMRAWVAEQVERKNLGATVHLLGRYPVERMPRFFALADVMLVTLKKDPIFALTIPSKLPSYLACAKPVVAALAGEGARVVTEAGAGVVVDPEEPAALAQAVLHMSEMPTAERQAMGARGRAYFNTHFDRNTLIHELESWMAAVSGH